MALNGCTTTRIYCRENCPPGRRTKPEHRVHFASEAEAVAAGYRACKVCRPDGDGLPWRPRAVKGPPVPVTDKTMAGV